MEAVEMKKKGFNLFKKKEEEIPVPQPPKELPKVEEPISQEQQINVILLHMQKAQQEIELAKAEFINLLDTA